MVPFRIGKRGLAFCFLGLNLLFLSASQSFGQESYLVGEDDPRLQIVVNIIGEVQKPGQYMVHDGTNIVELLAKAGGPSEFSSLSNVSISRIQRGVANGSENGNGRLATGNEIIKVNLEDYVKRSNTTEPPVLKPGDVVFVPRNSWSKWRNVATIVRDISVVASLYLLYLRVTD